MDDGLINVTRIDSFSGPHQIIFYREMLRGQVGRKIAHCASTDPTLASIISPLLSEAVPFMSVHPTNTDFLHLWNRSSQTNETDETKHLKQTQTSHYWFGVW